MTNGSVVRFWHPKHGGWHIGHIAKIGRKWIVLNYQPTMKRVRVPVTDVAELPK